MRNAAMKKIIDTIKERDTFVVTAHVNPEGDAVGSTIAMAEILKSLNKKYVVVSHDPVPDNLLFLEGVSEIKDHIPMGFQPETAIYLDCPVKERTGSVYKEMGEEIFTINIDHHESNEHYGDVVWVDEHTSSAGEMVYELAEKMRCKMTMAFLESIYASIITDTGMFNYANTSDKTHVIVSKLITQGVEPDKMYREIYEKKNLKQQLLLGKVLSSIELHGDNRIAFMHLTKEMVHEVGITGRVSTEEFINYPRSIKGVKVAIFFNESQSKEGSVNISFRSSGEVNVNKIASFFGGGGHPRAAGCLINLTAKEAKKKIIKKILEEM